jgi:hypothetical protein
MKKEEGKNERIENHIKKKHEEEEMMKRRKKNVLHLHFLSLIHQLS